MIAGNNIKPIFIFSLPRSGSTLLQRILVTNDEVSTASEPWVLLPFLYTLKKEGVYAEYAHSCAYTALQDLCKEMPNGEDDYLVAVRLAMLSIYANLSKNGERYFLDKTPRYALVVDEVIRTFPNGKFIFLWRNPLAVIASMIETFADGKWKVFRSEIDLFDGQESLLKAFDSNDPKYLSIKYEGLVENPENSMREIEHYLVLDSGSLKNDTFSSVKLKGRMGDPTGIKKYQKISKQSLDGWKRTLASPVRKFWCKRYLKWVGKDRLLVMGYNLDVLLSDLEKIPNKWSDVPLDIFYSFYGLLDKLFEFKILKGKLRNLLSRRRIKRHA